MGYDRETVCEKRVGKFSRCGVRGLETDLSNQC